jgi:cell division protein FtsW (lipid II flippase)
METHDGFLRTPPAVGLACAGAATGLGLAYMAAAGAPAIYLAVNALSLVMGIAGFALVRLSGRAPRLSGGVAVALGGLLLATALFGTPVDGASRWVRVGSLSLQVSLIVVPAMLVAFARRRDLPAATGVVLAAVALALQPDRAMAGVLISGLAALALFRRDRWVVPALAAAVAGFAVTLLRPDSLPAVPYVDRILYTAFEVHAMAGIAVVGGALLLVVPAIAGLRLDPENREVYAVFGAAWLGVVAAAALGNYPTPLVGYGGSAILGYALSLSLIPGKVRSAAVVRERAEGAVRGGGDGGADLRIATVGG